MFVSFLTIWELARSLGNRTALQMRNHGWKCSVKILITNLGSVLFMVFYLAIIVIVASAPAEERSKTDCILYFMYSVILPVVLSVLNPVVFVLFTPQTFRVAWKKLIYCQSVPSKAPTVENLNSQQRQDSIAQNIYKEQRGSETPRVYQIGETSTVVQVKRVSEKELQNIVYSNFHTIRKETDASQLEKIRSPIVFDLSGGADRQRRIGRFKSVDQSEALLSPTSQDSISVFSRNSSVNVARRENKGKGTWSRPESDGFLDTRYFPNEPVVPRAPTAPVDENLPSTSADYVRSLERAPEGEKLAPKETEARPVSQITMISDREATPKESTPKQGTSKQGTLKSTVERDAQIEINENLDHKPPSGSTKNKISKVMAEIVSKTTGIGTGKRGKEKREAVLSNSDNMCVEDSEENADWELEEGGEFSGLRKVKNNTLAIDKTLEK